MKSRRPAAIVARERAPQALRPLTKPANYGRPADEAPVVLPKTEPARNRALLELARGQPCLLRIGRVCNDDRETTVAAHSNLMEHGKGGARKADDQFTVWACARCHTWLDQSYQATLAEKHEAWLLAHVRQVEAWRRLAADPSRSLRDRAAARWALERQAGLLSAS
ncbi:nuclease domain-containing protein [uncultured Pseudacidovorax sp.]|uniref:nuclease domain-containing protein n=1 Tax=uncultured Pseudacidovorax sp. TaxID=679313 RepID=UPI0025F6BEF2|nr:nuclease domain-containing protein [uncultured Pseudacidovorax sp.]